mmetsp:Transcript_54126/g.118535  ORF Transcript_54126/g.118535 Transcript_54126/m.118535 type:complete len:279 (+) Transcript_54126:113-949(+)
MFPMARCFACHWVPDSLTLLVLVFLVVVILNSASLTAQIGSLTAQVVEQSQQVRKLNDRVQNITEHDHPVRNMPTQLRNMPTNRHSQEVRKLIDQLRNMPTQLARFQMRLFAHIGDNRRINDKSLFIGGEQIALHSQHCNGFVRMNDDFTVGIPVQLSIDELPPHDLWPAERFSIVDVGESQIALHSRKRNRFVRMNQDGAVDTCCERDVNTLPVDWPFERFTFVLGDSGAGQIALYNQYHNRFLSMERGDCMMGASESKKVDALLPTPAELFTLMEG